MKKPMTQEERFVQMIETPVSTLIPRLAVPTIISMLVTSIYNMAEGRIDSGIEKERLKLAFLKEEADYIIDTSKLLTKELKAELEKIFMATKGEISEQNDLVKALFDYIYSDEGTELVKSVGLIPAN